METNPPTLAALIACPECDVLHVRKVLKDSEAAHCVRCGAKLYSKRRNDIQQALALSLAGLVFFVMMVTFPFLGISSSGAERNIGLVKSIGELYLTQSPLLAILVGLLLVVFPLIKVLGLIAILIPLHISNRIPGTDIYFKLVERIAPWNMTEIYLVGVIVTFVKLTSIADVNYGIAFWAFIGFVVVMTAAMSAINFTSLWDRLEVRGINGFREK